MFLDVPRPHRAVEGGRWPVVQRTMNAQPADVIGFWREAGPSNWFAAKAAFDEAIRLRFEPVHHAAARASCSAWAQTADGALALVLLLDQSEDLADQDRGVALCQRLAEETGDQESLKWARLHREIIARFGRFPHRNPVLGRETTPDEQAFLDDGGFAG